MTSLGASLTLTALVCGLFIPPAAASDRAAAAETPTAHAFRTSEPIRIDASLDEGAWAQAEAIGSLIQREPLEGQPGTENTEVRIAYDDDALYFAIVCHARAAGDVVSTQLTRDSNLDVDDRVTIVLDPFFDHRNGFYFQVNPAGARTDGQVSNNAEHLSDDWDGIWSAATRRTEKGWIAEVEIPFKTLRFKPGQTVWGLNVERHLKRRNETNRWASPRLDVWIGNLAEAGRLEGLIGVRQGRGLDVRPYLSGGDDNSNREATAGLDVFKNLTPNLNASLSINTDFAETEVDARQVNLTRFPLFFPEKRAFFQEGAGVIDNAGLTGGRDRDLLPFFSRRMGLLDDREVPITLGAKLVGRQSGFNIGIVDVQTRDLDDNPLAGQNLLAARISRNLFRQSWIGGIVTYGNPAGTGGSTLVGTDARFATSSFRGNKNLSLDLFVLRTEDEVTGRSDGAGGFKLDYPNDLWDVALTWKQIGEDFQPRLGFVPRSGIRRTSLGVGLRPRPKRWGIRNLFFELRPEYITDLHNRVQNWRIFTAPFNLRTESGEHLEWNYIPEFEHLDAPFEIREGQIVPAGSYQWTRYRIEVNTATKRPWVVDLSLGYGGLYDGTRRQIEVGVTLKPSTHVALAIRTERNNVSLPSGEFYTQVFTVRGDYNFSPDVSWQNLFQYDNESRILGVQSRFRWILKPGNDLFLVINRGWFRRFDGAYKPSFDKASAKLQYTFRL
ncbi:MAG: hypothetical protein HYX76_00610 [Acidobacteria bacterium]|nr:hypothetical protein [Acidobacteriota bacterium]